MTGFTIPNYPDAVGKVNGIGDQAEPDSVDFQVLGDNTCGVVWDPTAYATNGLVTGSTSTNDITVANWKVISNGNYLTGTGSTIVLDSGGVDPRYDLVVITTANVVAVRKGTESSSNPVFPTLTSGDVLLAAIYRPAGSGPASYPDPDRVTDKRVFVLSNTTWLRTSAPSASDGVNGDIWIDTAATADGQSRVWVKSAGAWENLAEYKAMGTSGTSNLVLRDSSGNFSAETITANLSGNVTGNVTGNVSGTAGSAAAFTTNRTLSLTGDVTGSTTSNFSGNVSISTTLASASVENSMIDYVSVPQQTVSTNNPSGGKLGDIWVKV